MLPGRHPAGDAIRTNVEPGSDGWKAKVSTPPSPLSFRGSKDQHHETLGFCIGRHVEFASA